MTFSKFESLFKQKYPAGDVTGHGKFGGTERNRKVAVVFSPNGRVYEYYGAYEDILGRVGIKVISRERLRSYELTLKQYREWHGKPGLFGGVIDHSADIARIEAEIAEINENYIVV